MNKEKQAFTLVELIVVITILAILGTIAIMAFSGYSKNARDSARLSDVSNMKKSLELWILQSGMYPNPTNGTDITYSGATVWIQGIYGDSVHQTVGKLDKKPLDPIYDIEYTYSVTTSKKEYQLGAVLEKDMASNNQILSQTYAATEGEAYVTGNYNGVVTSTQTGGMYYMLAVPSIILSDISNITLLGTKQFVLSNKSNLPSSYANTSLTMTGSEVDFTPTVVWSGTGYTNLNDQGTFQTLVINLQNAYSNPLFTSMPEYNSIASVSILTPQAISVVKSIIETNTNQELTNVSTTVLIFVCTGDLETANADITNTTGLIGDTIYQNSDSNNSCFYTCKANYSGTNCETYTEPFVCGVSTVSALGETYTTKIGLDGKCWVKEFMRHGTKLNNHSTVPSDINTIEKWCYNNLSSNCNSYGALYTFYEAMGLNHNDNTSMSEDRTKSICGKLGDGWHLPTTPETNNMISLISGSPGWLGDKLNGILTSLSGNKQDSGYYDLLSIGSFWSGSAEINTLYGSSSVKMYNFFSWVGIIEYSWSWKRSGFSVICTKD